MTESPMIYDIGIDERRPVIQADADRWIYHQQVVGQYFRAQDALRRAYTLGVTGQIEWNRLSKAVDEFEKAIGLVSSSRPIDPAALMTGGRPPSQHVNWMGES